MTRDQRLMLGNIIGMRVVDKLDNYHGLPLSAEKNKTNAFRYLDRFSNRIKGWSKRLLSFGGKEVFPKVILQSILNFTFYVFLLPRGIIKALEAKWRNFWWESKRQGRGWAILSWDKLCTPKGMGRMGFKDLRLFNVAFFAR